MRLAERLDVPLRERNTLLIAAGYAPLYRERALADPQLAAARRTVELALKGHEPYPSLREAPVNMLRLSMHPRGLASLIDNWYEWRAHLLARLRQQIDVSGAELIALLAELEAYPAPARNNAPGDTDAVVVPLHLRTPQGVLSFFSTTTVFGTPVDITLSELAIEALFPADDATADALRAAAIARRE